MGYEKGIPYVVMQAFFNWDEVSTVNSRENTATVLIARLWCSEHLYGQAFLVFLLSKRLFGAKNPIYGPLVKQETS